MFKKLLDNAKRFVEESREIVAAKIDEAVCHLEENTNRVLDSMEEAADRYRPMIEGAVNSALKKVEGIEKDLRDKLNSATSVPPTAPEIQPKPVAVPPVVVPEAVGPQPSTPKKRVQAKKPAAKTKTVTVKKPATAKIPSTAKATIKKPTAKRPATQKKPTVRKGPSRS